MRKAVFLYNPSSGVRRQRRLSDVHAAVEAARSLGITADAVPTRARGSAGGQAQEAVAAGYDAVFACGGDGTVNEVLQGLIAAGGSTPLGIIPLGTGNVLAYDLGLSRDPARAALAQLRATPRRLPAGHISCPDLQGQPLKRYFILAAGIGVDAVMAYRVTAELKGVRGMRAYAAEAARMFLTHRFAPFEVTWQSPADDAAQRAIVSEVLVVRVSRFGPWLGRVVPAASLQSDHLQAVLFKTPSRAAYAAAFAASFLGAQWSATNVGVVQAAEINCQALSPDATLPAPWTPSQFVPGEKIYVQVDGECIGGLPAQLSVVPAAFTMLLPAHAGRS